MEMREFGPDFGQPHFARGDLMAKRAAECLETSRFLSLLRGPLCIRHLRDQVHRRQHGNTAFEAFPNLPSSFGKSELPLLADGVTALATVSIEYVLSEFLLTLARRLHPVERGGGSLRGGLGRR